MKNIAIVVPCFRVKDHILDVLKAIGPEVSKIYVVDDKCPQESGKFVESHHTDSRVKVIYHDNNQGVGGAVVTGYQQAIKDGMDVIVKIDGDNQMDPRIMQNFVNPIISGKADYTKGSRFYQLQYLKQMPWIRVLGNSGLSFFSKLSTGYWNLMDPTNGYTAVHTAALKNIELEKLDERYFFESDILYHLNLLGAVVLDIPMTAKYANEKSGLRISRVFFEFFYKHIRNFIKRILVSYFLRDFNIGSLQLLFGTIFLGFGVSFGLYHWHQSIETLRFASAGTVMLATLPIILGFQLILNFVMFDINRVPSQPRHLVLPQV